MEVIWRCKAQIEDQPLTTTVNIETIADLSDTGKREFSSGTQTGVDVSGRVRIGPGEVACIESKPAAELADCQMSYSYMALKRNEMRQDSPPPEGRYVRVENAFDPLSVVDISVFDAAGEKLKPVEAAMSSSYCSESKCTFPAARMIDGSVATFCCTQSAGESGRLSWLRVDLGKSVTIGRVEILTRIDDGASTDYKQKNGLEGAIVSVTTDRPGKAEARVWESALVLAGPKLLSYTWGSAAPDAAADAAAASQRITRTRVASVAAELYSSGLEAAAGLEYPESDFKVLETLLDELAPGDDPVLPSPWVTLEGDGVMMPFSTTGERARKFLVKRQFTSKAKPFWVQLQGEGPMLDVVMKKGDDLRQDQVVLSMLQEFNRIWEEAGVMHTTAAGVRVCVEAPVYRVACVGNSNGFVEMLPDSKPVDDIVAHKTRGENGWKACNDIIPSSVAAFIAIFALNIKDRHKGNMVVTGGTKLANIDFGWLEEGPFLDTGTFPIPDGLQYLLASSGKWGEFHDLAWDAMKTLDENAESIVAKWQQILRHRELNDDIMFTEVPERIKKRVVIERMDLDQQLRLNSWGTFFKDLFHGLKVKGADRKSVKGAPASPAASSGGGTPLQAAPGRLDTTFDLEEPEPGPEPAEFTPAVEPEPVPAPAPVAVVAVAPAPVAAERFENVEAWLLARKLELCYDPLKGVDYGEDIDTVIDGDDEEVAVIIRAVEGSEGIKIPQVKKFKRELAALRGKGEDFKEFPYM